MDDYKSLRDLSRVVESFYDALSGKGFLYVEVSVGEREFSVDVAFVAKRSSSGNVSITYRAGGTAFQSSDAGYIESKLKWWADVVLDKKFEAVKYAEELYNLLEEKVYYSRIEVYIYSETAWSVMVKFSKKDRPDVVYELFNTYSHIGELLPKVKSILGDV